MSNRRMHMSKRLIRIASITCAVAVLSAPPADAVIASPESGSRVSIGNKWEAQPATICGLSFNYVQRMTINGVSTLVPTEFIYTPGRHALVLQGTCDGYNIYGVGIYGS